MKKIFCSLFILFVFSGYLLPGKKEIKNLPPKYQKWLEEEVVYIITPKEKEVFLQLETDRERDLFIEAFWKHRDPEPSTPENEFKKEHYQRIAYANKWLGRGTPTVGWRTDMGRIHIILGKPKSIERYENETEVYPTVVWFYQGMSKYGLPDSFNVVFFKKYGSGDYELYSPLKDGPQNLLIHYSGDTTDYLSAFYELKKIRPQLAQVSLTLLPGESYHISSPSIASEILLGNINTKPQKAVKDQYAEKLLKYKDIVDVEYTANYIDNDHLVSIIRDKSGICFVHYLIEPKRLSVNFFNDKYYTSLEISGKVTDLKGKTIYQFTKSIPIKFDEEQLKNIQSKPFSLQDMFPLIEGNYKFNLLLKNTVSKEFTSIERDLIIPYFQSLREMTPLILTHHAKNVSSPLSNKPFKVGDIQLYPSPRNDFSVHDKLFIFFQIPGISEEIRENGRLQFIFYKGDQEFLRKVKEIKTYPQKGQFLEEFSLENFPPAQYRVKVSVLSKENKEILFEQAYFFISPLVSIPRPFIYSELAPSSNNPLIDYILGGQYFNQGNYERAKVFLERAYQKRPDSLKFAEGLSRTLFTSGKFEELKKILSPFLKNPQKDYRFLKLLGQACQKLNQFEEAITYYKQYLSHYGTNLEVLNAIGYCNWSIGNKKEALEAWEKSLEIEPKQEQIKKLVTSLKGEK
ncbi:MAG: GWxTD domain-containing protein [Candidatus Aminicenantia bacterium]